MRAVFRPTNQRSEKSDHIQHYQNYQRAKASAWTAAPAKAQPRPESGVLDPCCAHSFLHTSILLLKPSHDLLCCPSVPPRFIGKALKETLRPSRNGNLIRRLAEGFAALWPLAPHERWASNRAPDPPWRLSPTRHHLCRPPQTLNTQLVLSPAQASWADFTTNSMDGP